MDVPFSFPDFCNDEIQEVINVLNGGWLTTASRCSQFEKKFKKFIGSKYALVVNSGTAALHLGLEALGIREGDKVLVPTFTFTATAEVVRYLQADPIFVDCDRQTFCITEKTILEAINNYNPQITHNSIKGIIPVHFGGHPCDLEAILNHARNSKLTVLEDAAHALPTKYNGRLIGTFGDATCFSFYANKTITTGEGGMVCTDNDDIAERVKLMRLHGINRDVWDRYSTGASWEYDIVAPGFKYNMSDIAAAIGIHQLNKVELFRKKRQRIAQIYYNELENIPGCILQKAKCKKEEHSWYLFMVIIEPEETKNGINRNKFIEKMTKSGIGTSVHYKPLHRMTYYKKKYDLKPEMFPNAEWVYERCVCLPIYSALADDHLAYIIKTVKAILL
jgi:dTDP-4-amino-4,6-dideoxygalactose transaminase